MWEKRIFWFIISLYFFFFKFFFFFFGWPTMSTCSMTRYGPVYITTRQTDILYINRTRAPGHKQIDRPVSRAGLSGSNDLNSS